MALRTVTCRRCKVDFTYEARQGMPKQYCDECRTPSGMRKRSKAHFCSNCGVPVTGQLRRCPQCQEEAAREAARVRYWKARGEPPPDKPMEARAPVCGCGRDYMTVPLEHANECPRPRTRT